MSRTIYRLGMACLASLPMTLGCVSSGSSAPAARVVNPTPVARSAPKAELVLPETVTAEIGAVYFDTDQSLLREGTRATLRRYALAIQQHSEWGVVTIEGHCDERGSEEYNVALGGRRAAAVVGYLTDLGVPAARLETRTYGEMRPAVPGHNEAAWRQNRRTELESQDRR